MNLTWLDRYVLYPCASTPRLSLTVRLTPKARAAQATHGEWTAFRRGRSSLLLQRGEGVCVRRASVVSLGGEILSYATCLWWSQAASLLWPSVFVPNSSAYSHVTIQSSNSYLGVGGRGENDAIPVLPNIQRELLWLNIVSYSGNSVWGGDRARHNSHTGSDAQYKLNAKGWLVCACMWSSKLKMLWDRCYDSCALCQNRDF